MASGMVQSIMVLPSRVVGEVVITSPYSRKDLFSGTVSAAATFLVTTFPRFVPSLNYALGLIQRGREIRGAIRGVGYNAMYDTQRIS